ncbi:hypothetical protein [Streptomyces sp. NPDC055107]
MTAAEAMRSYWSDDALERSTRGKGEHALEGLRQIVASYPGEGLAARGRGLALGLATADGATADRISAAVFERGLLLETCGPGGGVLKLLPPLTVSHSDLDLAPDILDASVKSARATHVGATATRGA